MPNYYAIPWCRADRKMYIIKEHYHDLVTPIIERNSTEQGNQICKKFQDLSSALIWLEEKSSRFHDPITEIILGDYRVMYQNGSYYSLDYYPLNANPNYAPTLEMLRFKNLTDSRQLQEDEEIQHIFNTYTDLIQSFVDAIGYEYGASFSETGDGTHICLLSVPGHSKGSLGSKNINLCLNNITEKRDSYFAFLESDPEMLPFDAMPKIYNLGHGLRKVTELKAAHSVSPDKRPDIDTLRNSIEANEVAFEGLADALRQSIFIIVDDIITKGTSMKASCDVLRRWLSEKGIQNPVILTYGIAHTLSDAPPTEDETQQ